MRLLPVLFVSLLPFSFASASYDCRTYLVAWNQANKETEAFGGKNPNGIAQLANQVLRLVPSRTAEQVQIAAPVQLAFNPNQPQQFGDGVQNANLSFGPSHTIPFTAILVRPESPSEQATLTVVITREFPGLNDVSQIEVDVLGERKVLRVEANLIQLSVSAEKLGWNSLLNAAPLFFRPVGWKDWFSVQFPQAYVKIDSLLADMAPRYRTLPGGESLVDPLGLKFSADPNKALEEIPDAKNLGFLFAKAEPRVHGVYQGKPGQEIITATGTAITRYRLPHNEDFPKVIYLSQSARNLANEAVGGLVSGTGPHRIGEPATAEIILNSLGNEPLLTFHGFPAPESGPNGEGLAWRVYQSHLYVGTWLAPGQAFVATRGTFHQHLTHTTDGPVFAQVVTPPQVPSATAPFGFPRE